MKLPPSHDARLSTVLKVKKTGVDVVREFLRWTVAYGKKNNIRVRVNCPGCGQLHTLNPDDLTIGYVSPQ